MIQSPRIPFFTKCSSNVRTDFEADNLVAFGLHEMDGMSSAPFDFGDLIVFAFPCPDESNIRRLSASFRKKHRIVQDHFEKFLRASKGLFLFVICLNLLWLMSVAADYRSSYLSE